MWFCCGNIAFGVACKPFFHVYSAAYVVIAVIELEDIDIEPHRAKIVICPIKKRTSSAEARLLNNIPIGQQRNSR